MEIIKLSIIIPAYNEIDTIEVLVRRLFDVNIPITTQIIIVDDGSSDGTQEVVWRLAGEELITACFHNTNLGKGACLRTAIKNISEGVVLVQDADLEYDPSDIPLLLKPILDGRADVVYGSRFLGESQGVHLFWHRLANKFLTSLSNMLNNLSLSDMETGYKVFRREILAGIKIRENRFGFEPEITAKIAKRKCRVYEVPISYSGRDYHEGKKIGLKDAFRALWCIIRYRIAD